VGDVLADQPRPDVARNLRCDPHVGFQMRLPDECRNGHEFAFSFKVLPEGSELSGSPVAVRYQQVDAARELRALAATLDELCASAFRMQQQIRNLLPAPDATVANYDPWARRYQAQLRSRMAAAENLPDVVPLVSVIMPTSRPSLAHLTAAIESVRQQTYGNWELIIADDGSFSPALAACIRNYAAEDARITCILSRKNRGIPVAANAALRKAKGEIVAFLGHDDLMAECALEAMVREALRTGAKLLYSDEDRIDEFGVFGEPNLKPDWNYRLLLAVNYVGGLVLVEHQLLQRAGALRPDCDGAQDHDLLLRLTEHCLPEEIRHVPEILYHGRRSMRGTEQQAVEAGRRAIAGHLERRGFVECQVRPIDRTAIYSISWGLRAQPSVSVIVPFRDEVAMTRRCLDALLVHTDWKDWKIVLVDNGSDTEEAAAFCRDAAANPRVVVQRIDEPFNFARLNNLASRAHPGDFYLFLNNDVIVRQSDWLRIMVDEALADPAVAVVGTKLVYPNGMVQHAGVVLGVGGVAEHAFKGLPADAPGYMSRARCAQQYSAVTAACMLCRADAFLDAGGFDEHELAVAFNDVDLCLKIARRGGRVVWTPAVVAEHHESLSRGDDMVPGKAARFFRENYVMFQRWHEVLGADPFYNPHFSERPNGAVHQWRKDPPRKLSVGPGS
jgi:GT2 family glycosyltransferase